MEKYFEEKELKPGYISYMCKNCGAGINADCSKEDKAAFEDKHRGATTAKTGKTTYKGCPFPAQKSE